MNHNMKISIAGLVLLMLILIGTGWSYWRKVRYNVDLNLSPEQEAEYEAKVEQFDKEIRKVAAPNKPDIDFFLEKARYQEYLGSYGDAIETLLESFKYYENTSAGWNNIAKLYDKAGDYKSAIIFYNKLINTFSLYRYYLDVAWDYYRIGKIKTAQEAYGRYVQLEYGTDNELDKLLYK